MACSGSDGVFVNALVLLRGKIIPAEVEVEGERFERHGPFDLSLELGHLTLRSGGQGESLHDAWQSSSLCLSGETGNLVVREGERIDLKQIETVACGADDVFGGGEHFDFPAGFGEEEFHEALPEGR